MYPDIEYVVRKRYALSVILRCCVILLFMLGGLPLLQLLFQFGVGAMFEMFYVQLNPTDWEWQDYGVYIIPEMCKYAVPAGLLLYFRLRLVRWIAPFPKSACPQCDYDISKLTENRCPECGIQLPKVFMVDEVKAP